MHTRTFLVATALGLIGSLSCDSDSTGGGAGVGGSSSNSGGVTGVGGSASGAGPAAGAGGEQGGGSNANSSSGGSPSGGGGSDPGAGGSESSGSAPSAGGSSAGGGAAATGGAKNEPREPVVAAPGTDLIKIETSEPLQRFEGWGTSLCWWANHVGGWDEAARNEVVDAVVSPTTGLGYNIFRYNIGGGENPSHDHMEEHREMPGFQDEDGTWTWENDARQQAILLGIAERGSDVIFEAFSNSPPYWMTESGCASGSSDGSANLKADSYDEFAHYLTEVVKHYRDEYGIVFRTLEPLNEPNSNWWKSNGSQEGCHFSPDNQERIIQAVAAQLAEKSLSGTVVSASDENSMDDALRNLEGFSEETLAVIGQLNVHSYAGSKRSELRDFATSVNKPLWQSESGPLGQSISDDTDAALFMAERIITDLRELRAEAWIDWQTGDPSRSWASFTLDNSDQSYEPLKRFYMHAGFSRYIRPGATFVEVDDSDMVAAVNADGRTLAIVVRNGDRDDSRSFTFDLTELPTVGPMIEVYRTSRTEDLEALTPIDVEAYSFVAELPPFSVTTFVVPML